MILPPYLAHPPHSSWTTNFQDEQTGWPLPGLSGNWPPPHTVAWKKQTNKQKNYPLQTFDNIQMFPRVCTAVDNVFCKLNSLWDLFVCYFHKPAELSRGEVSTECWLKKIKQTSISDFWQYENVSMGLCSSWQCFLQVKQSICLLLPQTSTAILWWSVDRMLVAAFCAQSAGRAAS